MGSGINDYFQLCKFVKPDLKIATKTEDEALRTKYLQIEKVTKRRLLEHPIDVYCLQEAGNTSRPLLRALHKRDFFLVHIPGKEIYSNVIALSKKRFQEIQNLSADIQLTEGFNKDVAIAVAFDKVSNKKVLFVSAHVPFTEEY